jgi:alpha-L-fucosidase 2
VTGNTVNDNILLNLESAWSGGPFDTTANYTGGNPSNPVDPSVWSGYRKAIWQSANGTIPNIGGLMEEIVGYGSYAGLGSLNIVRTGPSANLTNYVRWLDLEAGVSGLQWTEGRTEYTREYLCSNPSKICVAHQQSSRASIPAYTIAFTPIISTVTNITCSQGATSTTPVLTVRGIVPSDPVSTQGMIYEIQARVHTTPANLAKCSTSSSSGAVIAIPANSTAFTISYSGNTDFSLDAGDAEHGYSFKGADPHQWVSQVLDAALPAKKADAGTVYSSLRQGHDTDYAAFNEFRLVLGSESQDGSGVATTDDEVTAYEYNVGNRCV